MCQRNPKIIKAPLYAPNNTITFALNIHRTPDTVTPPSPPRAPTQNYGYAGYHGNHPRPCGTRGDGSRNNGREIRKARSIGPATQPSIGMWKSTPRARSGRTAAATDDRFTSRCVLYQRREANVQMRRINPSRTWRRRSARFAR